MLVSLPTETARPVRSFAGRTHGRFGSKVFGDTVGLPLDHAYRHGFINVMSVFVEAGIVQGDADISRRPRFRGVAVADAAHVAGLEILFAFFANGQAGVGEFNVEFLFEAGWYKGKNVLWKKKE